MHHVDEAIVTNPPEVKVDQAKQVKGGLISEEFINMLETQIIVKEHW